jgi:amino acid transporter
MSTTYSSIANEILVTEVSQEDCETKQFFSSKVTSSDLVTTPVDDLLLLDDGNQHEQRHDSFTSVLLDGASDYNQQGLCRHLNFWDLLGIGVGSTVGSGVFVLVGTVATNYAGPSCFISMILAGSAALCSGVCYAELSSRIPTAGSTYVYTKHCWGECVSVVAAACITLEYAISGAAVARTWGDKVLTWIQPILSSEIKSRNGNNDSDSSFLGMVASWLQPGSIVNIPACLVSIGATAVLLSGRSTSKSVTNWITIFKMIIIAFMIIAGLCLYDHNNMPPAAKDSVSSATENEVHTSSTWFIRWAPYGLSGISTGATVSFFGFLGYDEVCCVAGEAINPSKDMPRAVIGTIFITTICYVLAAIAITGMIPYTDISPTIGFPDAFVQRDYHWIGTCTAIGELLTLPVVVVCCLLPQPRLTYSMALDGLLPKLFCEVDLKGSLHSGTAFAGCVMILVATFCPFTYLDDLISGGILLAFCMTNSCLVLFRCIPYSQLDCLTNTHLQSEQQNSQSTLLHTLLISYNMLCFGSSFIWSIGGQHVNHDIRNIATVAAIAIAVAAVSCFFYIVQTCPLAHDFGGVVFANRSNVYRSKISLHSNSCTSRLSSSYQRYFSTPAVPMIPCLGTAINWYLIGQLRVSGMTSLFLYASVTIAIYLCFIYYNKRT